MMSGHHANPIFFNKKIKIGRPECSLTPNPLRPITFHFCLNPPSPPPPHTHTDTHPLKSLKMGRIFWVQGFRVQASRRPEPSRQGSKRPCVQSPSAQSPSVQASRVQASRPCVQSPAFPVCQKKYVLAIFILLQKT